MYKMFKPLCVFCLCLILFSTGCIDKVERQDLENGKYSFYILGKDGAEYALETNSLKDGELKPEISGTILDGKDLDRDVFVKDGFYYHHNRKRNFFSKFTVKDKQFKRIADIQFPDFSLENADWLSKDTLLLTGLNTSGYKTTEFALVDAANMKILRNGVMGIPKPKAPFTTLSIGFVQRSKSTLMVGYTYHISSEVSTYHTSDTLYVAELSLPDMSLIKLSTDTRSTYPGGINTIQNYSFTDDNGDYYFMSCPGVALGNRPEIPTGVFRIKANTNAIDKDYFLNISKAVGNHAYGMWDLGNGEVIIRAERKDLFKGLGDHYSTAHFEFYVINLKTHIARKLDLPLDKGTRRACVLVENGTAFISVNSSTEGNYIWSYDIKLRTLRKGLQLSGDTDFILRMDRIR